MTFAELPHGSRFRFAYRPFGVFVKTGAATYRNALATHPPRVEFAITDDPNDVPVLEGESWPYVTTGGAA